MELKIHVCLGGSCSIILRDETGINPFGYLPQCEQLDAIGRFLYEDTCAIVTLETHKTSGSEYLKPQFNYHRDSFHPMIIPVDFDGWFTIHYTVLPTVEWFIRERAKERDSDLRLYEVVYFTNGQFIYKCVDGEVTEVNIEEVLERNTLGTTISRSMKEHVSICRLKQCYINLCQQLFNKGFGPCFNKAKESDDLIFKRDIALMVINAVTYYTQFNQLAEAQRLIERIGGCGGICPSINGQAINGHDCGCARHKL